MTEGVTIVDPRNTYIDGRCTIGRDTVIYPVHDDHRDGPDRLELPGRAVQPICATGPCWRTAWRSAHSSRSSSLASVAGTIVRHLAYLGRRRGGRVGEHRRDGGHRQLRRRLARIRPGSATAAASGPARSWSPRSSSAGTRSSGANAVVTRDHDVADGQTVVGVPARPSRTHHAGGPEAFRRARDDSPHGHRYFQKSDQDQRHRSPLDPGRLIRHRSRPSGGNLYHRRSRPPRLNHAESPMPTFRRRITQRQARAPNAAPNTSTVEGSGTDWAAMPPMIDRRRSSGVPDPRRGSRCRSTTS